MQASSGIVCWWVSTPLGMDVEAMLVDVDIAGGSRHPPWSRLGGTAVTMGRSFGSATPPGRVAATAGKDAATLTEVLSPGPRTSLR